MASPATLLLIFLTLILFFPSQYHSLPFHISVSKHPISRHYVTRFLGRPTAVDIAGTALWLHCHNTADDRSFPAYTYLSEPCSRPGGALGDHARCSISVSNPVTGAGEAGELRGIVSNEKELLFVCAPPFLLRGLAAGVHGVAGLGRSRISLPSQLSHRKFAVCLPSSADVNGAIFFGSAPSDLIDSLMYTQMISKPEGKGEISDGSYYIGVAAIKIAGKRIDGSGGTKISTISPFTILESTIFDTLTDAFSAAASDMGITRLPPFPPFKACFSTKEVNVTSTGPAVPMIEMVLQSDTIRWKVLGANSMVFVSKDVMCLAFVDGGRRPTESIVIGGHQLEDNLVEFDVGASRIGFSSSLLVRGSSCSSTANLLSDH